MSDPVLEGFLKQQLGAGHGTGGAERLARLASPRISIATLRSSAAKAWFAPKAAKSWRRPSSTWASGFPSDYCRHADPFHVLTWLYPHNVWHPNIRPPLICVGKIPPATELCDLLYQCYEIITYFNWAPHDGLNSEACQWARNHQDRFPGGSAAA